ncbi:MAG TPA: hypothetical protein VM425_10475 [Myxococcota bacterium]|nr:hypothetical protein [Myxococcota bacterium]
MKSKFLLAGLFAVILIPLGARATVLEPLRIEDLARLAPLVVVGEVNQVKAELNAEKTKIYTRVLVTPSEILKGARDTGTVTIKTIGGKLADRVAELPGAPQFEPGERVLVFLEPRKDGDGYNTLGLYLGKFSVVKDPHTGKEVLYRPKPGPGVMIRQAGLDFPLDDTRTLAAVREIVKRAGGAR